MTQAVKRDAAWLLNQMADSFESGEYVWGTGTYYRLTGDSLGMCAVGAARFEIAGKPWERTQSLARNEPGPRQYEPAYSMLIGILTGESRGIFETAAKALIATDPQDRVDHRYSMAEFKVTYINDGLESPEQAVGWIRSAARYVNAVSLDMDAKAAV